MENNQQQFFTLTAEIKTVLKEEIEKELADSGRELKDLHSKNKSETGFPVSWWYLCDICKKPVSEIDIKPEANFRLLQHFGYTLKSFIFTKNV